MKCLFSGLEGTIAITHYKENLNGMDVNLSATTPDVINITTLPPFFQDEYTIIIPAVWAVIIIVGCIGNGLVIYTLCKNGEMTPTNCYVVNLAAADLTFILVVMTITAIAFAMPKEWEFGDLMCKLSIYMVYVSMHNGVVCVVDVLHRLHP